jgi:cytoskeletal protein CcmA (bactofilin family)
MAKDDSPAQTPPSDQSPSHPVGTRFGSSLEFKGELTGHEHVLIEGRFEGQITIPSGTLTIAKGAKVKAEMKVRELILDGECTGNINAGERVQISETGQMEGDITSSRVSISNGARFKGSIKVDRKSDGSSASGSSSSHHSIDSERS